MRAILICIVVIGFVQAKVGFSADLLDDKAAAGTPIELEQVVAGYQGLTQIMDHMTEIATKTRLNADFVPGMVTVLNGSDLKIKGVHTVAEALNLVPGFLIALNTIGTEMIFVRGAGGRFFSGNVKLMLNGISITDTLSALGVELLQLPIQQVERIDVIRGPGSAMHGEYAYAGVVNVITSSKANRVAIRIGSFDTEGLHALFSHRPSDNLFFAHGNFSAWNSAGSTIDAGTDLLYNIGLEDYSFAPGHINDKQRNYFINLTAGYKQFTLTGQFLLADKGDYHGIASVLPPPESRIAQSYTTAVMEAKQKIEFSDDLSAIFKLGWRQFQLEGDKYSGLPPGIVLTEASGQQIVFPNGSVASPYYVEEQFSQSMALTWHGFERHTLLSGIDLSQLRMVDTWVDSNVNPITSLPFDIDTGAILDMQRYEGFSGWIEEDKKRMIAAFYVEDIFAINPQLTLTTGLHFDHYSDVGDSFSPRIALVYQLGEHHILKTQYSEAFRPPSFTEMYSKNTSILQGNSDIEAQTVNTYELGYIFKTTDLVSRFTVYQSKLENLISINSFEAGGFLQQEYANSGAAKLNGVEAEIELELAHNAKVNSTVSYADSKDMSTNNQLEGAANWLVNLGFSYQPFADYMINFKYQYVGKRNRGLADTRPDLNSYNTVDVTWSIYNLLQCGVTLQAAVKNIFADAIYHPAPAGTYVKDFPLPKRRWGIQLSYDF